MPSRSSKFNDTLWITFAAWIGFLVSLVMSLAVLIAWVIDWPSVQSLLHGLPTMKFNTALCLALLSTVGLLRSSVSYDMGCRHMGRIVLSLVFTIAVLSLAQDSLGINLGIDDLVVADSASIAMGNAPGRMSPGTSLAIILLALGLLVERNSYRLTVTFSAIGGVLGVVAIMHLVSFPGGREDVSLFMSTAFHTAHLIVFLSVSNLLITWKQRNMSHVPRDIVRVQWARCRQMFIVVGTTVCMGFLVTAYFVTASQSDIHRSELTRFQNLSDRLSQELQRHLHHSEFGLNGARGMILAMDSIEANAFETYVNSRDLKGEFPGATGFGFIERVSPTDADESHLFSTNSPQASRSGKQKYVVKFLFPKNQHLAIWNVDIGTIEACRTAIEEAITSRKPTLTARIQLAELPELGDCCLQLVPVFRNIETSPDQTEQKDELIGLLFAPLVLSDTMNEVAEAANNYLDFELFTLDQNSQWKLAYDADHHLDPSRGVPFDIHYGRRFFKDETQIHVGGRDWLVITSTLPKFEAESDRRTPALIGVAGILMTFVMAGMVWSLGMGRGRALAVADDITRELRASEVETREIALKAQAANRAKSEFLANMSHEIRTPMTAILGFTDLLLSEARKGPDTSSCSLSALQTIHRNGEQLLTIINDILDMSKIEAGKLTLERMLVSPSELMHDVWSLMSRRAEGKGITLKLEFDGSLPEQIETDPTRLRQVLVNLVGNALKFTEVGSVTLVTRIDRSNTDKPKLLFSVVDTGIGMTQEQVNRISEFNAFTQADTSTSRQFGGTGLGLRISNSLAQMLGGNIQVSSIEGQGSTFTVSVDPGDLADVRLIAPSELTGQIRNSQEKSAAKAAPEDPLLLQDIRIMLVEDGPDNQRLMSHILRKGGATVETFGNGRLAVEALTVDGTLDGPVVDEPPFDVILMDMQMPEMDGYTATATLKVKGLQVPIIALTAHAMADERERCLESGCDDYATKPIDREKLFTIVRTWAHQQLQPASFEA